MTERAKLRSKLRNFFPAREPFVFVDNVLFYNPDEKIVAEKRLTGKEWFLKGHFPGNPIMPGHLIAESMAQACALLFTKFDYKNIKNKMLYLVASRARFFKIVKPGDTLTITAYPVKVIPRAGVVRAEVHLKKELVAKGEFTLALESKKKKRK
jgi:3-hydroxyacyl-[acyl-carrier-protein] dehydratase